MAKSPLAGHGRVMTDLPEAEHAALLKLAERQDLSVSQLVRRAVRAEMALYGVGEFPYVRRHEPPAQTPVQAPKCFSAHRHTLTARDLAAITEYL